MWRPAAAAPPPRAGCGALGVGGMECLAAHPPWQWLLLGLCYGFVGSLANDDGSALPLLCFEEPAVAKHKGVAVALRLFSRGAGEQQVSYACEHRATGTDAAARSSELRVGFDASLPPQAYELHDDRLTGGDVNGVIYGLLDLRDLLDKRRKTESSAVDSATQVVQHVAPAFSSRVYSIEGQYLDLPDVAYYSTAPPYLNASLVAAEAVAIARGLPALVQNSKSTTLATHG